MRFVFTAPRYHTNQHFPIKALLDAGHEVSFLVLRQGQSETYEALMPCVLGCSSVFDVLCRLAAKGLRIRYSETGGIPPVLKLWREMRRVRPSVVVVRDPGSAYGLLSVLMSKLIGARLIFYTQTPRHRRLNLWKRSVRVLVPLIAGAGWFTPVLGDAQQYHSPNRTPRYVPFVIEPQTAPEERSRFKGGFIHLLTIGKFIPRKEHDLFLDAVERLSRRYSVRAAIVGACTSHQHCDELKRIQRRRAQLRLDDVVSINVNLSFRDVQKMYATHDVFVLASCDEPAAVSPLEAMAHSLPVVLSDSNGTSCYLRSGENGLVFRSGDLDDLVTCLDGMLEDRERLVNMGRRSYQMVLTEHAPARYVNALLAMAGSSRQ